MFNELPFVFKFGSYKKALHLQVFKTKNLMPFYLIAVMIFQASNLIYEQPHFHCVSWYLNDVYNCSQSPLTPPSVPHPTATTV